MFDDDYLMRQIEAMARGLAKILLNKEVDTHEILDNTGMFSEENFLFRRLETLVMEDKINEAENLLFDWIEGDTRPAYLRTAIDFYRLLQTLPADKLGRCNFSVEEIADGLRQVCTIYGAELPDGK